MELQRHIEIQLLANDCVIVPDFGGFMTHQIPAHYDTGDYSFVPPMRTLGFNPQLRMNDSLLVQSYVEAYDISYPEALRRIEDEVAELKTLLSEQGSYTLEDLGTLTVNQDGNYEFAPCEAGILTPELFGLGTFTFNRLKDTSSIPAKAAKVAKAASEQQESQAQQVVLAPQLLEFTDIDSDDSKAISIRMSWIRNAVAVAAAVVAFFLLATPVTNSDMGNQAMTHLQQNILYKLIPQDTNKMKAEPVVTTNTIKNSLPDKAVKAIAPEKPTLPVATISITPSVKYCIVVASQVKKNNAEEYVERLHREGYAYAKVYVRNNTIRVLCGEYDSEAEAYRQLNKMNNQEQFAEAWVYKLKPEV